MYHLFTHGVIPEVEDSLGLNERQAPELDRQAGDQPNTQKLSTVKGKGNRKNAAGKKVSDDITQPKSSITFVKEKENETAATRASDEGTQSRPIAETKGKNTVASEDGTQPVVDVSSSHGKRQSSFIM